MHSCFYEGTVAHHRSTPAVHGFRFALSMVYVDLAELDSVFRRRGLWSTRFPAPARFHRADYLGDPSVSLAESVRRLVAERTGADVAGPIRLLTNFRQFGFGMNPVSFYFCFDAADEQLEFLIAEVHNTPWNERHCYVLELRDQAAGRPLRAEIDKEFHVSPFMEMNQRYRWQIHPPREELTIRIANVEDRGEFFAATLSLTRVPLTAWHAVRILVGYPWQTLRIYAAIYWQAWRLWRKRVPYVPHPAARAELQPVRGLE